MMIPRLLGGLLVCVMLVSCGKTEKKRRTLGYRGEARANAFLAGQRLLEKQGRDVRSRQGVGELGYDTAVVFVPSSSLNTVGRAKRLLGWVAGGGHLVVMLAGGEKRGNDFRVDNSPRQNDTPGVNYLLKALDVEKVDWPRTTDGKTLLRDQWEAMEEKDRVLLGSEMTEYTLGGRTMKIRHWSDQGLLHGTGKDKHRYLSLAHGMGRVTLLTDASPLRNRYIGYADHARFLTEIVARSRAGAVVFSNGEGEGFFGLVWRYFWMAVLGLLTLVVFWLWKNLPQFGPSQDVPDGSMREFSGQVRGIGRFLWRHKRDDVMLGSLRRTIRRRLSLMSGESHAGDYEQLSTMTGIPLESIKEAMTREGIRDPGAMVRVVRNLQTILKHTN